jgi:type III restriction enzyme
LDCSPKSGLSTISDRDGLKSFISEIKIRFSSDNTFVYNSTDKTNSTLLPILDDPKNYNRVIFSVDALTEG